MRGADWPPAAPGAEDQNGGLVIFCSTPLSLAAPSMSPAQLRIQAPVFTVLQLKKPSLIACNKVCTQAEILTRPNFQSHAVYNSPPLKLTLIMKCQKAFISYCHAATKSNCHQKTADWPVPLHAVSLSPGGDTGLTSLHRFCVLRAENDIVSLDFVTMVITVDHRVLQN